uniref:Uncharacterized protein n=1 Tax=Euplotes harpa TaxID=151035 RepID=A0A7S3JE21_9SPIT|mmetsp:Transcript_30617/g.35049  ORF Transcript_30617/g.35049 Transcript_30617/m.35049 type:complete len:131 (+) Transcript_30617:144-536(+)
MNHLVKQKLGIITTDPRIKDEEAKIDHEGLKQKQKVRLYNVYIEKLLKIVLNYSRPVSQINENVALQPVTKEEILSDLLSIHGVKVAPENLSMSQDLENIGDSYLNARFFSTHFDRDFSFTFVVRIMKRK